MTSVIDFLTNGGKDAKADSVVQAQAFSLTKVLAVAASLVTALATWLASQFKNIAFSSGQLTVLLVALIAFVAITASADVIARGVAAASQAQATANERIHMLEFSTPLQAKVDLPGDHHRLDVRVVGVSRAAEPEFLCVFTQTSSRTRRG